jgi:hypothetical protein
MSGDVAQTIAVLPTDRRRVITSVTCVFIAEPNRRSGWSVMCYFSDTSDCSVRMHRFREEASAVAEARRLNRLANLGPQPPARKPKKTRRKAKPKRLTRRQVCERLLAASRRASGR